MASRDRGLIPACDVGHDLYKIIVQETAGVDGVVGYKVGFCLAVPEGLSMLDVKPNSVYRHGSAGTDISDFGGRFAEAIAHPNIQGAILTPLSGPETQAAWTKALKEKGKQVYVEPILDEETFLVSQGGYVSDDMIEQMIELALNLGCDGLIFPETEKGNELAKQFENESRVLRRRNGVLDADFEELTAYDVLPRGLLKVVATARNYTDKPIIYDHQKAGTDVSGMGEKYAEICKAAGVDEVIFFPQAGPKVQKAWTEAAQNKGLDVNVGGWMTHPKYLKSDGGYIANDAVMKIYSDAVKSEVSKFIVPGNKVDAIQSIRQTLESEGKKDYRLRAPGLVKQGGVITETGKAAGQFWDAIMGRGLYEKYPNVGIKEMAIEFSSQL